MVELFKEAGDVDEWLAAYSFGGTTGDITLGFLGLSAGSYYYRATGVADGTFGGTYILASSFEPATTPIPEADTYAMFVAGLGTLGLLYRRRRSF